MKKKKLAKAVKRLEREVQELSAREEATWSRALGAIAGAVATALSDAKIRERLDSIAADAKEQRVVTVPPEKETLEGITELQNGVFMDENPGPV
jgi:hypothetical protein